MAKITDPSRLLPSTKSTAITKIGKGSFISPIKISKKTSSITKGLIGEGSDKDAVDVNNKLVKVEKFLGTDLIVSKKKAETKRREKEKEDYKKEEEKLEAPKEAKKFNLPSLNVPGMSFLDRIKRFLFFTALGWLFTKFQDQLPKLVGIVKVIGGVYGVAENIFKVLLGSFVSFIERGYDAYDKVRDIAKSIGGEKAQQDFDKLSNKLNEYINYVLIGGLALTGAINSFNKAAGASTKQAAKEAAKKTTGEVAKRAATKGIVQRTAQASRIGATKAAQAVIGKQATRQLLRAAKGPLSRLPVVGALVEFGLSWALGEPVGKAAFRGVGTLLLGTVGSLIFPGIGTFIGGFAGAELAGKLYEVLFENKKPQGNVQRKQAGGSVTRDGRPQGAPKRKLKVSRKRPPKVKPQASQPGKNVGGKKKIKELYPDPSARVDIEGEQKSPWYDLLPPIPKLKEDASEDDRKEYQRKVDERNQKISKLPNPYKALTSTAKILKDIPFGIGALMGGAVDIALGQKLPQDAIKGLGNGVSYLINSIASRQISASISNIEKEIVKMQAGGPVPKLRDFTREDSMNTGEGLTKSLNNLIQEKVDKAIKEVQKQMMPGRYNETKPGTTIDDEGIPGAGRDAATGPDGGTPGARLRDGSNAKIEADLLEYFTGIYGKNAAIGIVANLRRESGYRTSTPDNSSYEGMAQWDRNYRWPAFVKWAEGKGLDPYSRNAQAQYIAIELKQLGTDKRLKSAKTPEEAASIFYNEFERGAYSKPVKSSGYDPNNPHENKNKGFIQDISKGNPDIGKRTAEVLTPPSQASVSGVQVGQSKVSQDISDFRKFRTQFGGTSGVKPTAEPEYYQIREMGTYGSGDYQISPLADDTNYEINVHTGAGHWENRAFDIPVPVRSKEGDAIANYWRSKGYTVIWKDGGSHDNHVHVEVPGEKAGEWFKIIKSAGTLAMKDGKEGIIENGVWKPKAWTAEEKQRYKNIPSEIFKAPTKPQPNSLFAQPQSQSQPQQNTPSSIFDWNKKQGGGEVVPKQSPNRKVSSLRSYPSYSTEGGMMIAIQPIIIERTVPVPMRSSRGISFPVAGVNNSMGNSSSLNQG